MEDLHRLSSWRAARAAAESDGWALATTGDWSWLYRSADGERAWRITPFDPAFRIFAEICVVSSNPHLPRTEGIFDHHQGGYSVLMEWLDPVPQTEAEAWFERFERADEGPIAEMRRQLDDCAASIELPLFAGIDKNPDNILRRRSDGCLVFTDAYWINGPVLYEMIQTRPHDALELFPAESLAQWAHLPCMDAGATALILGAIDG